MEPRSADEILDFAIGREQEAHDFYNGLAAKAKEPVMKNTFLQFAAEELGHKKKLEGVKAGKSLFPAKKVMDLKIGDYLVDVEPEGDLDYQHALILAMKREKAAFRLYTDLAALVEDNQLKLTFLTLAQEEAKHKLRFEVEYDNNILAQN